MTHLVCLLEERSAEEMLRGILPKILPDHVHPIFIPFEGKSDLEKQMERKIRGWKQPDSVFLILRDQDAGDCRTIKQNLVRKVEQTRKDIKLILIRIACHELETFYLGDLRAVEQGLQLQKVAKKQQIRKFRNPDLLGNPSEELEKLTRNKYQKIQGSKAIAPHLDLSGNNRSHSFNILVSGIRRIVSL